MSRCPNRALAAALLAALVIAVCGPSPVGAQNNEPEAANAPATATPEEYAARMEHQHRDDTATPSPAATIEPAQPVIGEEVVYWSREGKEVRGYLARPATADAPLPGVLVIQEWWGLNDHIRAMARRIAGEGYVALAVDLYEGRVAATPEEAGASMRIAMARPDRLSDNLAAARRWLVSQEKAPKVGVVGWCFGGGWSLQAAIDGGEEISAAVMYYGRPNLDPEELGRLRAPLLGLFGAADDGIPLTAVRAMESQLDELGRDATIVVYEGAGHAFANPTGQRYQEVAASDAWRRTVAFLASHLQR